MNIVLFSPSWPSGADANGIVTYCSHIVSGLRKRGHNVYVISPNVIKSKDANVYSLGLRLSLWQKFYCKIIGLLSKSHQQYYIMSRSIVATLNSIHKDVGIDVFEIEESFGWSYYVRNNVNFPVVLRLHGPHYINTSVENKQLTSADYFRFKNEKKAFENISYVSAPSSWVLDQVSEQFGQNWKVKKVFRNPISLVPPSLSWSFDDCVPYQILFVGRFDSLKGGEVVLQAFLQVLDIFPQSRLVFVGPDRGLELTDGSTIFVNEYIDKYFPPEKRNCVDFKGFLDKDSILTLRKESHLTVMASKSEVFPYAVLESLASSAPIIASKVGGVAELIEDGVSGVFFEKENTFQLYTKIIDLLNDESHLMALSSGARQQCEDHFTVDIVAEEAIDFYTESINDYASKAN